MKGSSAHPEELTYPCCLPALGELGEVPPRGGPCRHVTREHARSRKPEPVPEPAAAASTALDKGAGDALVTYPMQRPSGSPAQRDNAVRGGPRTGRDGDPGVGKLLLQPTCNK